MQIATIIFIITMKFNSQDFFPCYLKSEKTSVSDSYAKQNGIEMRCIDDR